MNPLVSVVIPAYNSRSYVAQAVESVLTQTFHEFEIIVIDDGSTDDTRQTLAAYADRIRYVHQENRGVYAARNRGAKLAQGQYIAFLDADDVWLPEKLAVQVGALESHPEFGAAHTDTALIGPDGRVVNPASNPKRQSHSGMVFDEFFQSNMAVILLSTVLIRRDCFEALGGFDERHRAVQDQFFFLRLAWSYPIYFIPKPLVQYRITPGSLSRSSAAENISLRELLLREFIKEHGDYFASRSALLRNKWRSFHYDAGLRLFYARQLPESRRHLRKALGAGSKALLYWLATFLPRRAPGSALPR
jgi:glycosyltransferase involved in cell wall biosynthesis